MFFCSFKRPGAAPVRVRARKSTLWVVAATTAVCSAFVCLVGRTASSARERISGHLRASYGKRETIVLHGVELCFCN